MGGMCPCFPRETREDSERIPADGIDIAELNESQALAIARIQQFPQHIDSNKASLKDFKLHKVRISSSFNDFLVFW